MKKKLRAELDEIKQEIAELKNLSIIRLANFTGKAMTLMNGDMLVIPSKAVGKNGIEIKPIERGKL